jgi:hypothetical protein
VPFADVPRMSKGCLRTKFGVQPRLEDHSLLGDMARLDTFVPIGYRRGFLGLWGHCLSKIRFAGYRHAMCSSQDESQ